MKVFRVVLWVFVQAAYFAALYFGTQRGVAWCLNVFTFFLWLVVACVFINYLNDECRARLYAKGSPVSPQVAIVSDLVMTGCLAALGWYWSAGFWIVASALEFTIYTERKA